MLEGDKDKRARQNDRADLSERISIARFIDVSIRSLHTADNCKCQRNHDGELDEANKVFPR